MCVLRRALAYRAETWHEGKRVGPEVCCEHILKVTLSRVKGHPEVNLP